MIARSLTRFGLLATSLSACGSPAPPPGAPVALAPSPASPSTPPRAPGLDAFAPGAKAAADGIRPEALAAHIRFLADDLLEGRAPGTPGFELGARYVASELQGLGLKPAGDDGTFFQKVDLVGAMVTSALLDVSGGSLRFQRDKEFIGMPSFESPRVDIAAELVFVGYGLEVPEYHYDDFANIDLRGKIAVRFGGAPRSDRADFFPALPSAVHGDGERINQDLKRRGAIGVITVRTPTLERVFPFARVAQYVHSEAMALAADPKPLPAATLSGVAFEKLLKHAGREETMPQLIEGASKGRPHSFSLGLRAKLHIESKQRALTSENVVAVVPADPTSPSKNEIVMYGAHLDHMGIGDPVKGDRIYNGASDDGAGVSSLLETARAFTHLARAPRRQILFLFVTGEERGLLGSQRFAEKPTVPLNDIVADIDVDAAYPIHPLKDVIAVGTDESSLGADVARAADALGLKVSPDPDPDQVVFVRSDNYSFVKKGVPAAQIMNGTFGLTAEQKAAEDTFWQGRYHQPQDEYEPTRDFGPFADLTRFNFLLGVSIAEHVQRPAWNARSWFRRFAGDGSRPVGLSGSPAW